MVKVELLRLMYPSGTRIKLIKMNDPPETNPIPPGSVGTIDHVDDGCQLQMRWDNGRSLALVPGVDEYVVLSYPTQKRRYVSTTGCPSAI